MVIALIEFAAVIMCGLMALLLLPLMTASETEEMTIVVGPMPKGRAPRGWSNKER